MGMLEKIALYSELWQKEVLEKKEAQKNKLERDSKGKPIIELSHLENTVVNLSTQEEYDTLMQVYECGGWRDWQSGRLPTSFNMWYYYKKETCVDTIGVFGKVPRDVCQRYGYKVISTQEFYKKQNITKEQIKEIKEYFENKK